MNKQIEPVTAAYVHIPFCIQKCSYCDFISYPNQSPLLREHYCAALLEEIRQTAIWSKEQPEFANLAPLQSVFVGGGTPTVLQTGQLSGILEAIDKSFGLNPQGEFTLEANPGTVTADSLRACRESGFNRISIGLQAIQPHLLKLLGRIHSLDDFISSVELAADANFASINADMMFGLPGQTLADVAATVDLLLNLPIDHISFYSLSLEEGTKLHKLCVENPALLPSEELERDEYHLICGRLKGAGFEHYEISNAARPGHRCRHNLVYWQGKPYFGFGVAAHSFIKGIRRANTDDLKLYLNKFLAEGISREAFPAALIMETVDEAEAKKEMLLLGLRLLDGVSCADFMARFGCELKTCFGEIIERLVRRGLLLADSRGVRLTTIGLDLANQVFQEFV